ncbi:proline--tRNA ligase [Micromonospora maritima]|uniref:proline--tRNA ligase n=1 Tax=Micromonospora maritima TaxID=986711 RepID=UPI00157D434A|nr:proline--tRNA ligase [Micromonospora maritima]
MLLRMSTLLHRTLREDPADAEVASDRLLLRASYVRRAASGGYAWLPLGKLVLDRITAIVRDEVTALGDQEVHFPTLLPADPKDAGHLPAPTPEETAALLVKDLLTSYRDLPVTLFEIRTTFRGEARPRAGALRGREMLTEDGYSFDLDPAGLRAAYDRHREAYRRVFTRLGLDVTVVHAPGGSVAEEFLATAPAGEDTWVECPACHHAARVEAVVTRAPAAADPGTHPATEVHDTPETPTIASLVDLANTRALAGRTDWTAADTLKNVVLTVRRPGSGEPELLVVGLPGDRDVDLTRVGAALHPATVAVFDDWSAHPELVRGYLGPQILAKHDIRYLVDPRVVTGSTWLTGANEPGRHATDVVCGRDFVPDGTIEAAEVRPGDPCPACDDGRLTMRRGIEVGHVRQLGRRITDAFAVDVLGPEGKPVRPTMGSYGIGLSRAVAAVAEQHHDDRGLVWPAAVAPCDVHLVVAGKGPQLEAALDLGGRLAAAGLRVLVDDRTHVSAGVKFTDAELIGVPRAVVVGRRLADGYVELRDRATGERTELPVEGVVERLRDEVGATRRDEVGATRRDGV